MRMLLGYLAWSAPGCAPPKHGTGQDKGRKKSDVFSTKQ
jgi:hypothetical protein